MESYKILMLIIAVVTIVFLGICLLIPYLVKRGINLSGILTTSGGVLDTAGVVIDGIQDIIPNNPSLCIVERIIDYAKQAVAAAEQMYKASQIEAEARNAEATELVYEFLSAAHVEITDDVDRIVKAAIEAAVFSLPQTHRTA